MDQIFGVSMQKSGLNDTMSDLIVGREDSELTWVTGSDTVVAIDTTLGIMSTYLAGLELADKAEFERIEHEDAPAGEPRE